MWTEPDYMASWWGPKEVSVGYSKMDFRRGGSHHYAMVNPDGSKMWGKMKYIDIVKNKRLIFINMFSDEQGGVGSHPMAPDWPQEILSTISFEEEKPNQTKVTIEWRPINATAKAIECFNQGHESMTGGWTGSLDRLEERLK
jgi:uncharacterized protein YndB with AHSA1/START domain